MASAPLVLAFAGYLSGASFSPFVSICDGAPLYHVELKGQANDTVSGYVLCHECHGKKFEAGAEIPVTGIRGKHPNIYAMDFFVPEIFTEKGLKAETGYEKYCSDRDIFKKQNSVPYVVKDDLQLIDPKQRVTAKVLQSPWNGVAGDLVQAFWRDELPGILVTEGKPVSITRTVGCDGYLKFFSRSISLSTLKGLVKGITEEDLGGCGSTRNNFESVRKRLLKEGIYIRSSD